jgi:glutamine amidotransferase
LHIRKEHPIFKYVNENDSVYFVHSYYATDCEESLLASTEYGEELTAAVALDNVAGTQFHPEKSGKVGLGILKAFAEW